MRFEVLETLSLPGGKLNEDAFQAEAFAAVVFDGATPVNDPLMPGRSDAAWIAQFGARRLMSHLKEGEGARAALRRALADTEHSFNGLRRRAPRERHEFPFAAMMLAVPREDGLDAMWYGDCAALVLRPDGVCDLLGRAVEQKASESSDAARFAQATGIAPTGALETPQFLDLARSGRNKLNMGGGPWLFAPMAQASEHAARARIAAAAGTDVLLCTDGFLALAGDYRAYDSKSLIEAARSKGLKALGAELRAIEEDDALGRKFPRFKRGDDATAVLLKLV